MTPRESASVWRRTHPGAPHPPKPRRAGGAHDPDRAADRAPCGRRLPRRRQHRRPGARPVCHGPDAMTRAEAIERTLTALNSEDWPHAKGVVDVLGALGVLNLDEAKPPQTRILSSLADMVLRATESSADSGWMIGPYGARRILARIESLGYRLVKD